ncbi:MAG: maltose alpha-D-glucosyltransferase [Gemmatimonadota bacterium]
MPRAATDHKVSEPQWYKDAVIYELHVRAFADSNGDGMGDFAGLTEKLDYLADLGVTALWILPFYPSPWRDDGYDIADFESIHPSYGTMADFKRFMREARKRGLRVITELVINHTSDQHPWFQKARRAAPGTKARDMYVWSDTPELYKEVRIIFKDFEHSNWAWDPVAKQYYWHRFFSHQPDLNFDNPAVHRAIFKTMDFWFRMGVDGMRLDAIPYLYERAGTSSENLPETHDFLKELRAHVDAKWEDRMLLAEANQWPEETVPYFGDGDECHMSFHFPVMPRLFMSVRMEDRFPIIDILEQTPAIPEACQWATFLRNHDELTLEMVTDEERDYMYRVYANDPQARINLGIRRRLAPLLGNSRRKIELMNALLFSLPGTPVLYYGDEIGMGDNIYLGDRNGVRTPMQWSADRNAGFSRANPQRLYAPVIVDPEYHYESQNVEAQQANSSSLLWWMKRLVALRKQHPAFGRGTIEFLFPENRRVLAFLREWEGERILVVVNLSRMVQHAHLDLSAFEGALPVEMFGHTEFPRVGANPYFITLGPHSFYWFQLEGRAAEPTEAEPLRVPARREWSALLEDGGAPAMLRALGDYLPEQRWFQGKARRIRQMAVADVVQVPGAPEHSRLVLVDVTYVEGDPETYAVPLSATTAERRDELEKELRRAVIAPLVDGPAELLVDAMAEPRFRTALYGLAGARRRQSSTQGRLRAAGGRRKLPAAAEPNRLVSAEQSNTSVVFGHDAVLKLYRRLEEGVSLDLELGRFLSTQGFAHTPELLGAVEYHADAGEPRTVAVIHRFVPNEGDAWRLTLDAAGDFFERAATLEAEAPATDPSAAGLLALAAAPPRDMAHERVGPFLEEVRLLGRRTGELHLALGSDPADPAFAPEPFTPFYQRSLYQSMRNLAGRTFRLLDTVLERLPEESRAEAATIAGRRDQVLERFKLLIRGTRGGMRIRTHGDYHLGQVLFTGKDFMITDFEGEPIRPLGERRLKRSPLRDVAGMLRSFHYAVNAVLHDRAAGMPVRAGDREAMEPWADYWYVSVAGAFLHDYLDVTEGSALLPSEPDDLDVLLAAYLLDKAVYELAYELNNRPDWAAIPLKGLTQLLA